MEAALLREAFGNPWQTSPSLQSQLDDRYHRFDETRSWIQIWASDERAAANRLLARNLDACCKGTLGNQISLAWADYEWRRRHHFALELLLSAVCGLLQSIDTASPKELVDEARADFLRYPAALTALWPEATQAWGRSAVDAFSSVPAGLMAGRSLPFTAFTEMRASQRLLGAFALVSALEKQTLSFRAFKMGSPVRSTSDLALQLVMSVDAIPFEVFICTFMERCAIIPHLQVTLRKMAEGQKCSLRFFPEGQRLRLTANQSGAGFSNSRLDNTINILVDIGVFRRGANGELLGYGGRMSEANVVERLCATVRKAHAGIVLTHNIDFLFVESVVIPRLRTIGSPQFTIFADAGCAASSFQTQEALVSKLGSRYRVVSIDLGQARRFHPKALFLAGTDAASLAVGSGNTTYGGWSGNKEVWTDFSVPGDGGAQIASFREYLATILSYVPDPAAIRAEVLGLYSTPENDWVHALPEPAGLAWTPSATPMLDQIVGQIGGQVATIDVLSPYFDPDGAALSRIAELGAAEVRVMLQPKRAGISQDIVAALPDRIRLQGIEPAAEEARHKFIHAKAYAFETGTGFFVAAGSANCSRAALMADASWGNAELMAISSLTVEEIDDFWSGYALTDSPPELPEKHPSEDWTFERSDLRILAARKDGSALTVYFKAEADFAGLSIQTQSDLSVKAHAISEDRADFDLVEQASSVTLVGVTRDGRTLTSLPCWIDDERFLRMAPAERVLRDKLEEAAARGSLLGRDFLQILELFELHVQRDTAHVGRGGKSGSEGDAPAYFSESRHLRARFRQATGDIQPCPSRRFLRGGRTGVDLLVLPHPR